MNRQTSNPYHPDLSVSLAAPDYAGVPFAGRQDALARTYRQMHDSAPHASRALCFVGRRHGGKTALLLAASAAFRDSVACAPVFLSETPPLSEPDIILTLAQATTEALIASGARVSRLNELPPLEAEAGDDSRAWLVEHFLPLTFSLLRGRRLALLLDDADHVLNALRTGTLPADILSFLRDLTRMFPLLGFVLTLDAEYEPEIDAFSPLIGLHDTMRLTALAPEETRWLLQQPARGRYTVPDEAAALVHKATGGAPALVQHFGFQLYQRWEREPARSTVSLEDIRALTPALYQYGEPDFRDEWLRLSPNEKRVFSAVGQVLYSDPLHRVEPKAIERYLAEAAQPLDLTAIHAALRGLEYAEQPDAGLAAGEWPTPARRRTSPASGPRPCAAASRHRAGGGQRRHRPCRCAAAATPNRCVTAGAGPAAPRAPWRARPACRRAGGAGRAAGHPGRAGRVQHTTRHRIVARAAHGHTGGHAHRSARPVMRAATRRPVAHLHAQHVLHRTL
jgi:hypothetical protein